MKKRVVVTGIGVIAPNGIGKEAFWNALKEGKSGIKKISFFDASKYPTQIAGEVRDFVPENYIDKKKIRRMARFSQFAVACAKMALEDAGLEINKVKEEDFAVILGVSTSAMDLIESQHEKFLKKGPRCILPFGIFAATPHMGAGEIVAELGLPGSVCTLATGCASGLDAVGIAYGKISRGEIKVSLAGGVDAPITPLLMAGLCASRIMSANNDEPEKASRPFDRLRDGGVLSEGGGVVVLEEFNSALLRNANIYGEVVGYGESGEVEQPSVGKGLENAMSRAITNANLSPDVITHISAHAPSDTLLDYIETESIKSVFGKGAYKIPITSIKSMVGNPFGGIGGFQISAALLTLTKGIIPPTINYEYFDPKCDLDYTPQKARFYEVEYLLINSHGFGGSNSSLMLKKYREK